MAFHYLLEKNLFDGTFQEIVKVHQNFTHTYERKVFVLCLTKMLTSAFVPGEKIRVILKELLEASIFNLKQQREQEVKVVRTQAKKEINIPDNFGKKPKAKKEEEEDKEEKNAMEELSKDDDSEYEDDSESGDSDLEDDGFGHTDDEFDDAFDLKVTLDLLQSPFGKQDEYKEFKQMVQHFCHQDLSTMQSIENSMDPV
jgi:hypothetical protein